MRVALLLEPGTVERDYRLYHPPERMVEIAKFSLHLSPMDRLVGGKNASSNLMPLADEMRRIWCHNVHPEGYAGPRDRADHLQALRGR